MLVWTPVMSCFVCMWYALKRKDLMCLRAVVAIFLSENLCVFRKKNSQSSALKCGAMWTIVFIGYSSGLPSFWRNRSFLVSRRTGIIQTRPVKRELSRGVRMSQSVYTRPPSATRVGPRVCRVWFFLVCVRPG